MARMASWTRRRASSPMRAFLLSLITSDTVATDTPAASATSFIVTGRRPLARLVRSGSPIAAFLASAPATVALPPVVYRFRTSSLGCAGANAVADGAIEDEKHEQQRCDGHAYGRECCRPVDLAHRGDVVLQAKRRGLEPVGKNECVGEDEVVP